MCVSTTYGGKDWGRTPHGAIIAGAAFGKLPFVLNKISLEAVGVEDAADALLKAGERGRPGERLVSSRSAAEYGAPMPAMMMNNSITPGTTKKLATTMRVRNCQSRRCLAMRAGCWVRPTLNMLVSTKSVVSVLAKDWKNSNMG